MKIDVDIVTRQDVRVSRTGWVTHKAHGSIIGLVTADVGAIGNPIWRANSGDIGSWAKTRPGAIAQVIDLHNMQEKARAYDLIARFQK